MTAQTFAALRRAVAIATPLALALMLPACDSSNNMNPVPTPSPTTTAPSPSPTTPAPSPTAPTPTPTSANRNVSACLSQAIPGTVNPTTGTAFTPASLVIPDTIKIDLSRPAGFPNGRRLQDSVVDITLAALFLDLSRHSVTTFASLPLNPQANDRPFLTTFPFVAPPQGNPPLATGTGTSFNFRTDPASAYVRVDREGQPAVATAVIGAALKNAYNDAGPAEDLANTFVPEIVNQLTLLHNALADDLIALGLTVCSTP